MCESVIRVEKTALHNELKQKHNGRNFLSLKFNMSFPQTHNT